MPERPVLLYDGQCGFCTAMVARWTEQLGERIEAASYQSRAADFPDIERESLREAVHFVAADGSVDRGAAAVFRALATDSSRAGWWWLYRHIPGVAATTELVYRLVARHRVQVSRISRVLWGRDLHQPRYRIARRLFLSALGVVFFIAFTSAAVQVRALIGPDGISPATNWLEWFSTTEGIRWRMPSVFWWGASDAALHRVCVIGAVLSVILALGFAQKYILPVLGVLYLSLINAGGEFFSYQWDSLLVETCFFAIFFASWWPFPRPGKASTVSCGGRFLLGLLLFKLMFLSGLVKWMGGDPVWRDLSALDYHYWTQPLPTVWGWWAAQLPLPFQKLCTLAMFGIEVVVPFFIFAPRRLRHIAGILLMALQVGIGLTGNYNFFGLLTITLCIPLFDDAFFRSVGRRLVHWDGARFRLARPHWVRRVLFAVVTLPFGALTVMTILVTFVTAPGRCTGSSSHSPPAFAAPFLRGIARWDIVNPYGLFTCMTTDRPEIRIEGSRDGRTWSAYRFEWKLDDAESRPRWVQPHQPRLDWQMWFSALRRHCSTRDPWFLSFEAKLLAGDARVRALLEQDPFSNEPPRYVRAQLQAFEPTTWGERRRTGHWWRVGESTEFCPAVELHEGMLRAVDLPPPE